MTHQAIKLAVHCHNFVKWKRNVPSGLSKPSGHQYVSWRNMIPIPAAMTSLAQPALWPCGLVSIIHGKRKRLPGADLTMILYHMKTPSEGGQLQHYWCSPWHPCRTVVMEYPPIGQNVEQSTCLVSWKEKWPDLSWYGLPSWCEW